jgi:hypothetical protein
MPTGLTDIWKGYRRGEPVCIKAIRSQDLAGLMEIESVCTSFLLLEAHSARLIPDLPSWNRRAPGRFPSESTPRHRDFGDVVSILHHEPVDAGWEHYPVHPDEPGC